MVNADLFHSCSLTANYKARASPCNRFIAVVSCCMGLDQYHALTAVNGRCLPVNVVRVQPSREVRLPEIRRETPDNPSTTSSRRREKEKLRHFLERLHPPLQHYDLQIG